MVHVRSMQCVWWNSDVHVVCMVSIWWFCGVYMVCVYKYCVCVACESCVFCVNVAWIFCV